MTWMGHVACRGDVGNMYKISVGKPERKRELRKPRCREVENIKMDLEEIVWEGADWFDQAYDKDWCWLLKKDFALWSWSLPL
jgi:hypothetical protein